MWPFIKRLPKIALVIAILLVSTGMFACYWYFRTPARREAINLRQERQHERIRKAASEVEARIGYLIMVDNSLVDVETGEVLFEEWLGGGVPTAIYYDAESKKMIAAYDRGFVRYALDGKTEASILGKYPLVFSKDRKTVLFGRDKDIWRADVDWNNWKLVNEKQVTSIGQFSDAYFAANLLFATEKTLLVKGLKQVLRVNLENGEVHPTQPPPIRNQKQRSPDGNSVIGVERDFFYCYDIDSDKTNAIPLPHRSAVLDYEWLTDERCLCLTANHNLVIYDRAKHAIEPLMALPVPCREIALPSPDKHFVFCIAQNAQLLIDLQKKTATPVSQGQGHTWIDNDTFAFTRDVPDSTLRGMWLQSPGTPEKRISPEPYIARRLGRSVLAMATTNVLVFIAKQGVVRIKPDGTAVAILVKFDAVPSRLQQLLLRPVEIGRWGHESIGAHNSNAGKP